MTRISEERTKEKWRKKAWQETIQKRYRQQDSLRKAEDAVILQGGEG